MKIIVATAVGLGALGLAAPYAHAALPSDVMALMDLTVDPCENFYQYSCGSWLKNAKIPDGSGSLQYVYNQLYDRGHEEVKKIIEAGYPIIGEFYDSCMDTKNTATANGNKPIQAGLAKIQSVSSKLELAKLSGEFDTQGSRLFTGISVHEYDRDPRWTVLVGESVTPPLSDVPKNRVAAATKYILTTLKLGGIQVPGDGKKVAQSILEINRVINAAAEDDPPSNAIRYNDAEKRFPFSFKAMMDGAQVRNKSAVKDDSVVYLESLSFFNTVETRLWNAKSLEELKLFFQFVYVQQFANYLGDVFIANENEYWRSPDDRAQRCRRIVSIFLPELISEYYFKKTLGPQTQQYVKGMAQALQAQMVDFVSKQTWISSSARAVAQKKLKNVVTLVGKQDKPASYPFKLKADNIVDNFHMLVQYHFTNACRGVGKFIDRTA